MEEYDVIIIGSGPAGLSAGVYAGRYMLKTLIIGGNITGGAITEAHRVCNFPSQKNIGGLDLSIKLVEHAKTNGIKFAENETAKTIEQNGLSFNIKTDQNQYQTKKIILAFGRKKRMLNIEGEKEFLGKGISYCATCDCSFYKDKTVAVVGGGNSALTAALLLSEYASKVYIVYRKSKFFRAEPVWIKQTDNNPKIEYLFNKEIKKITGNKFVEKTIFKDGEELAVGGVFVEIGSIPDETLSKQLNISTERGYILTDKKQKTNIQGVYAAGDITNNVLKQVITAAAEGAIAAESVYKEIIKGD